MTQSVRIFSRPTALGLAKLAASQGTGPKVKISHMAIGDGAGVFYEPDGTEAALRGEVYRAPLNQLRPHEKNPNWLVAELVIPPEVGGWMIRELMLYDEAGVPIYIGNHAEQYKPILSQGSDETKTIRMVILVSDVTSVVLQTDPNQVLATQDWITRNFLALTGERQAGQFPVWDGTALVWRSPYQNAAAYLPISTPQATHAGGAYMLLDSVQVTLPAVDGLPVGASVRFAKLRAAQPSIAVEGTANERIFSERGSDSAVLYDINSEVVFVWTGEQWEV